MQSHLPARQHAQITRIGLALAVTKAPRVTQCRYILLCHTHTRTFKHTSRCSMPRTVRTSAPFCDAVYQKALWQTRLTRYWTAAERLKPERGTVGRVCSAMNEEGGVKNLIR